MPLFRWTRAKSIFVPELDAEHRNFHQIAEELHQAVLAGASQEVVAPMFRALLDASEDHLAHEERMMRKAQYRLLDWHRRQHDAYRSRAKQAAARLETEGGEGLIEFLEFSSGWLRDHIAVADRMMAACLRAYSRAHAA